MFYKFIRFIVAVYLHVRYKITVIGEDNIPIYGPVVIASNHISDLDPPLIGVTIKRELSFFAKQELFKIPVLGMIISNLNAFPVNRGKGDRAALKKSVEVLKDNNVLVIFPEGTRSKDKQLGTLQEGASFIASKANAMIVPAAIKGELNRKEGIQVIYGKPLNVEKLMAEGKKRKDITQLLHKEITALLHETHDKIA